jgi:hypothetical protein
MVTFNHLGLTVPRQTLEEPTLSDVSGFFEKVYQWRVRDGITRPGHQVVFMAGKVEQFVVLFGHDSPTSANPPLDHFGMRVDALDELLDMCQRAKEFQASDPRLEWEDYSHSEFDDEEPYRLHKFYTRFLLPLTFEVQYYEYL